MRKDYSVTLLCRVLKVSKSGYYAYLKRPKQLSNDDKKLLTKIKQIHSAHKGTYGAKRIAQKLKEKGLIVNHKRVARLMKEAGLKAVIRRSKTTKESKEQFAGHVYDNLLDRNFDASHSNEKWVTDMTEIIVSGAKFYNSTIIDLFNREVIAFEVSTSPDLELIERTLESARKERRLKTLQGVLIHSDQGSVYRSNRYHELSKIHKFTPSMSRRGNCWDNAVIESFFSHLKTEFPCFYPNSDMVTFEQDYKEFIRYYNERRIQARLGYTAPKKYYRNHKKANQVE